MTKHHYLHAPMHPADVQAHRPRIITELALLCFIATAGGFMIGACLFY